MNSTLRSTPIIANFPRNMYSNIDVSVPFSSYTRNLSSLDVP